MEDLVEVEVLSVGTWLRNILVQIIPIVGIIMLLVWGYGSNSNSDMKNWAKSSLILAALMIFISLIL